MELSSRQSRFELYKSSICLAYQSLGIVYGDLSTSPIYVYKSTFSGDLQLYEDDYEILSVLSLVFWTLTLVPLFKYVVFVLSADDNGEGGTFALYSLLCRNTKIGLINASCHDDDHAEYSCADATETSASLVIRLFFERHRSSRVFLLLVLLGTSMVISDGILTPSISVLSAVYSIRIKDTYLFPLPQNCVLQAFVKAAAKILEKIQEGVFNVSNETSGIKVGYGRPQGF